MAANAIPQMFLEACAQHPDGIAFQQAGKAGYERLSYGNLSEMARRFAGALIASGLRPGDRVAIAAENRLEWPVAFFGQTLAGAVAVPVNAELPIGDIELILQRTGARFLVATEAIAGRLTSIKRFERIFLLPSDHNAEAPPVGEHIVSFRDISAAGSSPEQLPAFANPQDLASIIFTSGTTGGAKGVRLTHGNFMANVNSLSEALAVSSSDRLLLPLPLHHAFPLTVGMLVPVALGGQVTLENYLPHLGRRFAETMPTVFMAVPALLEILERNIRRHIERAGKERAFERALVLSRRVKTLTGINVGRFLFRQIHSQLGGVLRFIISGGSALNPTLTRRFLELGIPLLQGWGLTEAAPVVTTQRWWPRKFYFSRYYESHAGSVGQPLPGVDVALIDVPETGLLVKTDLEGELIVHGPNVTPGYWQAPGTTQQVMSGDWLRTGDLGRIDRDGTVWITGRSKYVIVLDSGEKVHPEEVEDVLAQSPLIADVCVVPRTVDGKAAAWAIIYPDMRAVLDRLAQRGSSVAEAAVKALVLGEVGRLRGGLAPHKWPSGVILADRPLPKTVIGKVARERLAAGYAFQIETWLAAPESPNYDSA